MTYRKGMHDDRDKNEKPEEGRTTFVDSHAALPNLRS